MESGANAKTLREHTLRVAERVEAELEEERPSFIDGCPGDWQKLPIPEGRIVAKRQQMQWTKRGAHLLLQIRTRALDGSLLRCRAHLSNSRHGP
jgi:hypothetical protein